MAIKDALLADYDHEMGTTRRLLERLPDDKLAWKPHDKSMSLGGLATHVSQIPRVGRHHPQRTVLRSRRGAAQRGRAHVTRRHPGVLRRDARPHARLDGQDRRRIQAMWTLKRGGQQLFSMPRVSAFRSFVLHHIIHHRGQLSVYLRMQRRARSPRFTVLPPTKAREYTIQLIMSVRRAASSLAILVGSVSAVAPIASMQSSVPSVGAGKKNPLLKLAEPWPDADALKARRLEAEATAAVPERRSARVHADRRLQRDQQGSQPREHQTLSRAC